jgi:hypothetical protein
VHFEGKFGGPGKISDYVMLQAGTVYLTGVLDTGDHGIPLYGSSISVEGVLNYVPLASSSPNDTASPPYAAPMTNYYYIDAAKVRFLPPPAK